MQRTEAQDGYRNDVKPSSGLTEDEIGRMIDDAERHQEADEERRQSSNSGTLAKG